MPGPLRQILGVLGGFTIVFAIGVAVLYVIDRTQTQDASRAGLGTAAVASPVENPAVTDAALPEASPAPTATPLPTPTPTPTPVPVPFVDLVGRPDLAEDLRSPLPECDLAPGARRGGGVTTIACIGADWSAAEVFPASAGRIVHLVTEQAVDLSSVDPVAGVTSTPGVTEPPPWSWASQAALGNHVVIDHGPFAGQANMQTVYAGLSSVGDLSVGQLVDGTTALGTIDGPVIELGFSLWLNNVRQDGAVWVEPGPELAVQQTAAQAIGAMVASPTDPGCPLSLAGSALPGAARAYRNGTHQGIDFNCGTSGRTATAIADGTVVYLVNDYVDPTVADREALLRNAGIAGFTPHWTLVMLYGNVVIIDHGEIDGAGRVVTIAAHLESVDPAITLGGTVAKGQSLGEIGNRGTNASAEGRRGADDPTLHLHWELFVDNWYLGSGQAPGSIAGLISTALCGEAATSGC